MHSEKPESWTKASRPPELEQWVEVRLPTGDVGVAKWTSLGWTPLYPAGTPRGWRPLNGHRFQSFPAAKAA